MQRVRHGFSDPVEKDEGDGRHGVIDGILLSQLYEIFRLEKQRIGAVMSAAGPYQMQRLGITRDHLNP